MNPRLLILLVGLAAPVAAQTPGKLPAGGTEIFRFALHLHGVQPLSDVEEALRDPAETMIVVVGDRDLDRHLGGFQLTSYVAGGGSILIAAEGPAGRGFNRPGQLGPDWATMFDITLTGNGLSGRRAQSYQGLEGKLFVKPRPRVNDGGPSPFDLFEGVEEAGPRAVATDRPSEMTVRNPPGFLVKNLAGYPAGTWRRADHRAVEESFDRFAVSLQPQQRGWNAAGRMIVLADSGVLTNGLMGFERDEENDPRGYRLDNGNWDFANRTIDWLRGGFAEPRSRCLFIQNGHVLDRFAVQLPNDGKPPVPNIPPDVMANLLLNAANPIIAEAEKRNVFNRFLERLFGFPRLLRLFLIIVTVVFLIACFRRLARGRRKPEPAAVMTPYLQETLIPRGGVLRQRTASQLESGNLYEAARRRVRERFDVLGGRPGPTGDMPPILTANDLPDGPLLHQSVRWLWAVGYGESPTAIPPAEWDRTNLLLERVTVRAARGDWSFGPEVA